MRLGLFVRYITKQRKKGKRLKVKRGIMGLFNVLKGKRKYKQKSKSKTNSKNKKSPSAKPKGLIPVRIKKHRDKNGGHHHIIVEDIENKHVSVGLTTRITKGKNSTRKNYPCERDPLGTSKKSYMRTQGTVAKKKEYEPKEISGAMTPKDYAKAKEYADKAKIKYINEKNNKKNNVVPISKS